MTVLRAIVTPETVFPVAMEPIDMPWPPEHVESSMTIVLPELMATQSSWFLTVHLETVTEDALMSKPSVLWPRAPASPAAGNRLEILHESSSSGQIRRTVVDRDALDNGGSSRCPYRDSLSRGVQDRDILESSESLEPGI
jgi:hypothetical protein